LGLSLSQKLCALMGGGISASSELGSGSSFTIRVVAWMDERQATDDVEEIQFENVPAI
jgi:signal transduction histidine kinase